MNEKLKSFVQDIIALHGVGFYTPESGMAAFEEYTKKHHDLSGNECRLARWELEDALGVDPNFYLGF